jgi:TIGR03009 family protein
MRAPGWSLTILLFAVPNLLAQQPPRLVDPPTGAAPPLNVPAGDPKLDALLAQWEQRMKGIQAIDATVTRTETDAVVKTQEVFEGSAKFLRPDRADLYLKKVSNPQVYERFLLTGPFLYEFRPQQKLVRVHTLPQRAPGQPAVDDNFMSLLFGMSAQEAKRRYDLTLVPNDKDQFYHYLLVKPRMAADKAEFTDARLVLWKQTMLPRQIEFVQPSGNPIKWDIPKIDAAAKLGPKDFQKPQLPRDWQTIAVPAPGTANTAPPAGPPPTKIRSGGS